MCRNPLRELKIDESKGRSIFSWSFDFQYIGIRWKKGNGILRLGRLQNIDIENNFFTHTENSDFQPRKNFCSSEGAQYYISSINSTSYFLIKTFA